MGVVWRGQDLETGAWVAVKLLRPDYASNPAAVARFVGERNALIRFRHPNVVNLRDMIVEGDRLALVMDLITGGELDMFRQHSGGTLTPAIAVRLTAQICDGLAAAHAAGIVHRDLKPSNVLLQAGQVKIADFGISRIAGEARRTTTGTVMGTPTYLAPEVINGGEPTNACDVYAVGITLYELLAGQPPFDGHVVAVMQAHLQREAERIPGISDRLWEMIAACLSKDPAGRPTAADLARSLKALEESALGPGPEVSALGPALTRTMPELSRHTIFEPAGQARHTGQAQLTGPLTPVPAQPQGPAQSTPPATPLATGPATPFATPPATPFATPPATPFATGPTIPPTQSAVPVQPTPSTGPAPGQQAGPPPGRTQAGPPTTPPSGRWQRKHVLAGLATLVAVIAVAATVYATAFSSKSPASLTGGGLTKPTAGPVTSAGLPTPHHAGTRKTHTGGHAVDPARSGSPSPASSSHSAGHPRTSPTASASKHSSSPPVTTSTSPPASPTQSSVPFGVWACGPATAVPYANGIASGKTLTACIRTDGTTMQIRGTLTGATTSDTIGLAFANTAQGVVGIYTSPDCKAATCVFTKTVAATIGYRWYAKPIWYQNGTQESTGVSSPAIIFAGLPRPSCSGPVTAAHRSPSGQPRCCPPSWRRRTAGIPPRASRTRYRTAPRPRRPPSAGRPVRPRSGRCR